MSKEKISIVIVKFKSTTDLILLRSECKNLLQASQDYGFDLKDVHKAKATEINAKDFPLQEWNG